MVGLPWITKSKNPQVPNIKWHCSPLVCGFHICRFKYAMIQGNVKTSPRVFMPSLCACAQCIPGSVCMHANQLQLCPALCDPMDCSPPGSSVHGFPRQEYQRGLPCPPLGDLSDIGIEYVSLASLALAGRFFTASTIWEAPGNTVMLVNHLKKIKSIP